MLLDEELVVRLERVDWLAAVTSGNNRWEDILIIGICILLPSGFCGLVWLVCI